MEAQEQILKEIRELKTLVMAQNLDKKEMVSAAEAAYLTGYNAEYLRQMAREGCLAYTKEGRRMFFFRKDIERFRALRRVRFRSRDELDYIAEQSYEPYNVSMKNREL